MRVFQSKINHIETSSCNAARARAARRGFKSAQICARARQSSCARNSDIYQVSKTFKTFFSLTYIQTKNRKLIRRAAHCTICSRSPVGTLTYDVSPQLIKQRISCRTISDYQLWRCFRQVRHQLEVAHSVMHRVIHHVYLKQRYVRFIPYKRL